jgi:large repetitive protein
MKNSTTPGGVQNQLLNVFLFVLFLFTITEVHAQNCSVNAGVPETICPDEELFLYGNKSGLLSDPVTTVWSQVSGPSATIVTPNELTTQVTNLIPGSTYVF